jgi:hypothetical protein
MMFIVRMSDENLTALAEVALKALRRTPDTVPNATGKTDYFCVADETVITALRAQGLDVVELRDGWYADDSGGGIGISGHGRFWEVRDTIFTVKEAVGPSATPNTAAVEDGEQVNVRGAVFGV